MSSLSEQLNSFKNKVKSAPVIPKKVVPNTPLSEPIAGHKRDNPDDSNKSPYPKKKSTIIYSQPANTGTGIQMGTQIVNAIEYIKKQDRPVPFKDIERYMSTKIDLLLGGLQKHDRIKINMTQQTAAYVSIYNIYSKEELLAFLRSQQSFQGVPVKQLKDGWNGCLAAIEELEKEGDILVLRTKKENIPRYVWANTGGKLGGIDEDFVKIWTSVKVPDSADLPKELDKAGLKPTSVDPATIKSKKGTASNKKQRKPRTGKITNTHLGGLLKDYGV
ncbi:uncharacterized protein SAPINGB_P002641 [Magnusiomyces paraingens]|uniref:Transcription initiation factor IIE subunit beta n=1 Tax=Magnusiomyces paraingens TaxID=2606893 RepID=A0A5E8BH47_9ASCO|nr:uncharacterized protein SAPINGB_P002641 [Saprochaete ingens]VVT50181.1 unnamed protein product [Saprochaete ingens]